MSNRRRQLNPVFISTEVTVILGTLGGLYFFIANFGNPFAILIAILTAFAAVGGIVYFVRWYRSPNPVPRELNSPRRR